MGGRVTVAKPELKKINRMRCRQIRPQSEDAPATEVVVDRREATSGASPEVQVRGLRDLLPSSPEAMLRYLETNSLLQMTSLETKKKVTSRKTIYFVSPQLPHPCELRLWNSALNALGHHATVVTAVEEQTTFAQFQADLEAVHEPSRLHCRLMDTVGENRTFLAGLEDNIADANIVIGVGESSLATFQALKARRKLQNRLAIWQTSPRPPHALPGIRALRGMPMPDVVREQAVRKEILRNCDVIFTSDKDSSMWAYLENVNAQRIRRVGRGIDLNHFNSAISATQRLELRHDFGLPETDFIFLQMGPLEVEAGAIDTVFAFKSLLQSNPTYMNHTKLVFCGAGSAGADVRQTVVDLKLDDHVFFLNPNDSESKNLHGNQMVKLLSICDAVIHNPIGPMNGSPLRHLDCTYDLLCALASGLTVISNGHGWIGEWVGRFFRTFSPGTLHSQAKLMRESIEKQDRLDSIKQSVRRAMEAEFDLKRVGEDLARQIQSLLNTHVDIDTSDIDTVLDSIANLIRGQRYLDAINLIQKAFELSGISDMHRGTLFRSIGDCFTKLGDLESGEENYLRALRLDPYCAKTLIGLGTVALQRRDYNSAVPQFQKAVSLAPNDDMASLGLGLAFEGLQEMGQALHWAVRACQMNPDNTPAIFTVVKVASDLSEYATAAEVVRRYVDLHPHDVNMIFTLGGLAFHQERNDEATKLMKDILRLDPMNSRAHGLLGQIARKTGAALRPRTAAGG